MPSPVAARPTLRLFLAFLTILALLLLFAPLARSTEAVRWGEVVRVYDGDTLEVAGVGKVRLIGIDAPEREASERDRFFLLAGIAPERLREIAVTARTFAASAAQGKTVRLEFDKETRDRHGRVLAYVFLPDDRLLNRLLLEEGYAVVYRRFRFERRRDFLAAEHEARLARKGLWVGYGRP